MRRHLQWVGVASGVLLLLLLLAAADLYLSADVRMNRIYEVEPQVVAIPADPESLRVGERWVRSLA